MIKIWNRRSAGVGIAVLALALLAGCATQNSAQLSPTASPTPSSTPFSSASAVTFITYNNAQYGFTFTLPLGWKGYTLVNDTWQGWSSASGKVIETGPLLSVRHPLWTAANKRQDIPILIYTLAQ